MSVYFVRAKNGPVKIGYTSGKPEKRMRDLRVAMFAELELVGFIEGDRALEKSLHRQFKEHKIRGEWFDFAGAVAEYIKGLPEPPHVAGKKTGWLSLPPEKRAEIERLWFDKSIASNGDVARMVGYTVGWIQKFLGGSGRPRITSERAAEMASKTKEKRRGDRKSEEDARLVWGNLKLSDDECVALTGWPRSSALGSFAKGGRKKLAAQIAAESKAARSRKAKRGA